MFIVTLNIKNRWIFSHLSFCLFPPACLPSYLSVCLSVSVSVCLTDCLSVSVSVWLTVCLSQCLSGSVSVSVCLLFIEYQESMNLFPFPTQSCLPVCLPACLSVYLSQSVYCSLNIKNRWICSPFQLNPACLPACLPVCLCVCLSLFTVHWISRIDESVPLSHSISPPLSDCLSLCVSLLFIEYNQEPMNMFPGLTLSLSPCLSDCLCVCVCVCVCVCLLVIEYQEPMNLFLSIYRSLFVSFALS